MIYNDLFNGQHAVLVTIGGDRPRTEARHVANAFCRELGISLDEIRVSPYFPEDFFVFLTEPMVREAAIDKEEIHSNGRELLIRPWCAERHTDWVAMPYHVRLRVENVPLQAWNRETPVSIVERRAKVDFVKDRSIRREDTSTFNIWDLDLCSTLGSPLPAASPTPPVSMDGFVNFICSEVPAPILDVLMASAVPPAPQTPVIAPAIQVRRSARLAGRPSAGLPSQLAAQALLARRLGSLLPTAPFNETARAAYLALFASPLSDQAIAAIEGLVVEAKKSKKPPRVAAVGRSMGRGAGQGRGIAVN
ncbi:uncharacterized protein LOC104582013 [Brachypodium distachyon]|uniref:uncharacterized protein LOC104582013 n=1 Tax=Brachypodium distachyon TaxID=15368 RepID=UPI00052FE0E6|nr:uncharacterized protein LOC104582013 [Brachypodium distachyon]|eukprot:XP_010229566.1 uncharacterized protein LOC104582013 [Brachypodium distachyon]